MRNHTSLSGGNVARVGDVEYATLPAALNAAEDGDTVTLLKDHTTDEENPSTVAVVKKRLTLDLNSFSVDSLSVGEPTYNGETGENIGQVAITSGDLTVVDNSNGAAGNIAELMFISGELELKSGTIGECSDAGIVSGGIECAAISGGMSITGETTYGGEISITGGSFGPVSVDSGGSAEINGGSFSEIWAFDISGTAIALSSVLADGYAFYDQTNGEVQNGTATKLTNVTVKKHTHSGSPCACGYTCSHPEMDSTTGKCTGCDELIAQAGHLLLPTVGKSGIIGVYETRRKEHGL